MLHDFYSKDTSGQKLVEQTILNNTEHKLYKLSKGLLHYKDRIFISDIAGLHNNLLHEFHDTPTINHLCVKATLAHMSASFSWPGLYITVKNFFKHCVTCQHNKYINQKKKGIIATSTNPKPYLGRPYYGLYYKRTKLFQPHRDLGHLRPSHKICPFHCFTNKLHR
ncbi:unnamed protein product [Vicia faba]|uniref:Integrase zinc-binding domain-containing protein n=1 Tax=Vicia faba TaxID=3906 RepID=A0AAV0YUR3_VICFA|nr:unnamed protein product [Vicia faba]